MDSNNIVIIPIDSIKIGPGRRKVGEVHALAKSIEATGLINPIVVNQDHLLIAGAHRLEAFKLLGRAEIPAKIMVCDDTQAALMEMDEDLIRNELNPLQRARRVLKRKLIFDAQMGETMDSHTNCPSAPRAAGGDFTDDVAKKFGFSRRTVQEDLQIAQGLSDETIALIEESHIAKHKKTLIRLSKVEKEYQIQVARKLIAGAKFSEAIQRELECKPTELTHNGSKPSFYIFRGISGCNMGQDTVNLILTSSTSSKTGANRYEEMFKVATKLLKFDGFLIVLTCQGLLQNVFDGLRRSESAFCYVNTAALLTSNSTWQPILFFTKERNNRPLPSYVSGDELIHQPNQLESRAALLQSLLTTFSRPGDTVLDTFASKPDIGLETLKLGRHYFGMFSGSEIERSLLGNQLRILGDEVPL